MVRHGLTQWNADGIWQGWTDVPLSRTGEEQADRAGTSLAELGLRFAHIVSSDLARAHQTAVRMAVAVGFDPDEIMLEPSLRERNIGAWSGRRTDEIEAEWPGQLAAWRRGELISPPDGETETALLTRCTEAINRLICRDEMTLVVTHGGVIRTIERHYGAEYRSVPNVGGRWFARSPRGRVVPGDVLDLLGEGRVTGTTSL